MKNFFKNFNLKLSSNIEFYARTQNSKNKKGTANIDKIIF